MPSNRNNSQALFLDNLRNDCKIRDLKMNIVNLFRSMGSNVAKSRIYIGVRSTTNYAFVNFDSDTELQSCYEQLQRNVIDTQQIVAVGHQLFVNPKRMSEAKSDSGSESDDEQHSKQNHTLANAQETDQCTLTSLSSNLSSQQKPLHHLAQFSSLGATSSSSDSAVYSKAASARKSFSSGEEFDTRHHPRTLPLNLAPHNPMSDTVLVYRGANNHGHVDPNKVSTFRYVRGHKLGNETRNIEFKCGQGGYLKRQLVGHVSKYMCSFLNSEGGVLIIGVSDDGTVRGISGIDRRREDDLRTKIDCAVRGMNPKVFPSMYRVSFNDVLEAATLKPTGDLKVLEIAVERGTADLLYETDRGEVYLRRDGSVQGPLKASDIQEWSRIQLAKISKDLDAPGGKTKEEIEKLKKSRTRLVELNAQLEKEREELYQKSKELERERDFYKTQAEKRQSKVCVIS